MERDNPAAAVPDAADADLTGRTLGDYQVIRRLGKGGMGHVYLATQISLDRKVALKFLRADLANNPVALERFRAEAMAVARVTHANIVQVYSIDKADGLQFIALEYVEGRTLREFIEKKGPPDVGLCLSIMRQGASALLRAAELGIIHRDIKPDNILLTRKGEVKIADFGLARVLDVGRAPTNLTQSGVVMGTPIYMSPEQVEGKPLDTRSDLYSFGVSCYHMLAGHPPFRGATAIEVALQHLQAQPEPLASVRGDLPGPLCSMVHKMMAKDPAQRYQSSRELLRDLARLRDSLPSATGAVRLEGAESSASVELIPAGMASSTSTGAAAQQGRRAWNWRAIAFAGSLLLAGGLGAVMAWGRRHAEKPLLAENLHAVDPPVEVKQIEAILNKKRREEGLLAAVEPLLEPAEVAKPENFRAGFELCMKLALFYFDEHKLEEGKRFFARLESITNVPAYAHLGRLARAIALALENKARESNNLLRDIAGAMAIKDAPMKKLDKTEGRKLPAGELLSSANPRFRYWIAEAVRYNQHNGIEDEEVPRRYLRHREKAEAAEKKQ